MKKILIINTEIPYPLTSGGKQGVFHFIDKLRSIYDISLLSVSTDEESFLELKQLWTNVTFYPFKPAVTPKKKQSIISKVYNLPYKIKDKFISKNQKQIEDIDFIKINSSLYYSIPIIHSAEILEYIKKILKSDFDIIQIEFYPLISLVQVLPKNVEKIFIHHEIRYIRNEIEMSFFKKRNSYDEYIFHLSKQFEIENLKLFDKIVTVTDIDKLKLEEDLGDKSIFSSPSIIDIPQSRPSTEYNFNNKLTFVASLNHFPNLDGIRWFITNIWRDMSLRNPELELHIIGKSWNIQVFKDLLPIDNIFFDGYIKDLGDILPNSISIIPIRIGSGMRMKIIDAVNYAVPFITTSVGVEGLDFINEKDCYIVDTAQSYMICLETLIKDQDLQKTFIKNSNNTLKNIYSIERLINKRKSVYENDLRNQINENS